MTKTTTKFCISKQNRPDARHMTKIPNFECLIWLPAGPAAILTMILSLHLSRESSDFDEIWCADANFPSKNGRLTKKSNFCKHTREHLPNENRLVVDGKTISFPVYIRNSGVARLWVTWGPPFPSPPLSLLFPSSSPAQPLTLPRSGPQIQLGVWERCKLLSGVWGRAPAEIEFGAY